MKIKVIKRPYEQVIAEAKSKEHKHIKPKRPSILFRTLMKIVSLPDMWATHFKCEKIGMEKLGKGEPAFYLMNHSSFTDLEIVASVFLWTVNFGTARIGKHVSPVLKVIGSIGLKR